VKLRQYDLGATYDNQSLWIKLVINHYGKETDVPLEAFICSTPYTRNFCRKTLGFSIEGETEIIDVDIPQKDIWAKRADYIPQIGRHGT